MIYIDFRDVLAIKKRAEERIVKNVISTSMIAKTNKNKDKVQSNTIMESSTLQSNLNNISNDLGRSVKGKFGSRVRETFQNQAEKMQEFR